MARSSTKNSGYTKPPTHGDPRLDPMASAIASSTPTEPRRIRLHPQRHPRRADPIAWPPLPGALIGMPRPSACANASKRARVLLASMAERLAFARCGTRIYEALIEKLEAVPRTPIPSRDQIRLFRDEEAAHFEILCEAIESLGGDPLAPAARADAIHAHASAIVRTIADPQTPLARCVELLREAVRVDLAGWEALLGLARASGHDALEQRFLLVLQEMSEQLHWLTQWSNVMATSTAQAAA